MKTPSRALPSSKEISGLLIIILSLVGIFITFFRGDTEVANYKHYIKILKSKGIPYDSTETGDAKSLFLELWNENKIQPVLSFDDKTLGELVTSMSYFYPQLSRQELIKMINKLVPGKLEDNLTNLTLKTLLQGAAPEFKKSNMDFFAAETLNRDIESESILAGRGLLILEDYAFKKALYNWNKSLCKITIDFTRTNTKKETEVERLFLINSIDSFILTRNVPVSKNQLFDDAHRISLSVDYWVLMFLIAHEYAHFINGDFEGANNYLLSEDRKQLDINADRTALDIIMTGNFDDSVKEDANVSDDRDFKMAGALYAVTMLEILDIRTSLLHNKESNNVYTASRQKAMYDNIRFAYDLKKYTFTKLYSEALDYLTRVIIHAKIEVDSSLILLPPDSFKVIHKDKKMKLIFEAIQKDKLKDIPLIIAKDPEFYSGLANELNDISWQLTGSEANSLDFGWMDGYEATCSRLFRLASQIDQQYFNIYKRHAIPDYNSRQNGYKLIDKLNQTALEFIASHDSSASAFVGSQIDEIRYFIKK